ncbi:glycosyltransferase [Shewanella oncorhynchi]|uniref:glycosyltransferase n=1 Tax=Shewanella oncorhynchi TaxID=2726434 RepID=UPI003D7B8D14
MKKIFLVAPLSSGHLQKWLLPFANDYEFIFFTLHPHDLPDEFKNCKVFKFPRLTGTKFDFILSIPYLQFAIIKSKPSLIYASFLSSYGLITALAFSRCRKILSTWGTDVNGKPQQSYFFALIIKMLITKFEWINAPADHIKNKLIQLGAKDDKIEVFQYGIDFSSYKLKENNVKDVTDDIVRFISIRNWDALYNIKNIISAYSHFCQKQLMKTELNILGKGNSKQHEEILSLVSRLNFKLGKVNVVGFVNKDELVEHLFRNDVVVSVPSMDGTPLSLLESMYVGLIPIVSKIDANNEWVNPKFGFFADPSSIENLSESLSSAFECVVNNQHHEMIKENRLKVKLSSDYHANTNRLNDVFKDMINK